MKTKNKTAKNPYSFKNKTFAPTENSVIDKNEKKRYVLEIKLKKEVRNRNKRYLVILKNPSKAGFTDKMESDKTVNQVCSYLFGNKTKPKNIGVVVIANLFPFYETDSKKLKNIKEKLVDETNIKCLNEQIEIADKIIFAWGNDAVGCKEETLKMKLVVFRKAGDYKLRNCLIMTVKGKDLNYKNPLHGQVWGYDNYELKKVDFIKLIGSIQ